jgi:ferredoxin
MKPDARSFQAFSSPVLDETGLNCHAVFDLHSLPTELKTAIVQACPEAQHYRQLWMFANGGPQFWQAFCAYRDCAETRFAETQQPDSQQHPLDHFAREAVTAFLREEKVADDFQFLYPGPYVLNLQSLGRLLGWHYDTPLKIGLHPLYGLWFAYRAVVLVNADEAITPSLASSSAESSCQTCASKACMRSCPPSAISDEHFSLELCLDFRRADESPCAQKCIAREACPIATEYRYSDEQIQYHYTQSLKMLSVIKRV